MRIILLVIVVLLSSIGKSQTTPAIETERFYEYLNKGDSTEVANYLSPSSIIKHVDNDTSFSFDFAGFMTICPKFKSGAFREEFVVSHSSENLGSVQTVQVEFKFYLDGKLDHCGTDFFIWINNKDGMYIDKIISTSYTCEILDETEAWNMKHYTDQLNQFMDDWHSAAGKSDFKGYFGVMSDEFYYLGTDPGERWTKKEFAGFSKPYFEKKKGWKFTATERNWYFNEDYTVAWFDEKLDTWMEDCRGTGVLRRNMFYEWSLYHYDLTVVIENEKIKDFINLRKE